MAKTKGHWYKEGDKVVLLSEDFELVKVIKWNKCGKKR